MSNSNYETIRALAAKMRAEFNSAVAQMKEELEMMGNAHDPPGFLPHHQARENIGRLVAKCTDLSAAFVLDVTQSCGAEVGKLAQIESDNLLVKAHTLADVLLAKYVSGDDATFH
jgi:hypothetical protein